MSSVVHLPYADSYIKLTLPYPSLSLGVEPLKGVDNPDSYIMDAIRNPLDSDPLQVLVKKGRRVAILVDGPQVPGGYRKRVLNILLNELRNVGVKYKDITLVVATGVYRKPSRKELASLVGEEVIKACNVVVHDCEEDGFMVKIGETPFGEAMEVNKWIAESDLVISISKVLPWGALGGYNSGARTLTLDLTSIRTTSQYYDIELLSNPACNGDPTSNPLQKLFHESVKVIEEVKGSPIFFVELVATTSGQLLSVKAGSLSTVEKAVWTEADKQYLVHFKRQGDLSVIGVPNMTLLGNSTDNVLSLVQALTFVLRNHRISPVIRKGGLLLTAANCTAAEITPAEKEVLGILDKAESIEEVASRQDDIRKPALVKLYKDGLMPHPLYPLFSLYTATFTLEYVEEIMVIGCRSKLAAEKLKVIPLSKSDEAFKRIEDYLGSDPTTVILHEYFTKGPFIQCIK
ncbi:MAG: lactate racemase domain-containing protein [Candidatus Jordarchaeales archaeon]